MSCNRKAGGKTVLATSLLLFSLLFVRTLFAHAATTAASITSPTPGTTLVASTETFSWSAGTNIAQYRLLVGSSAGASNYFAVTTSARSATVTTLPANGSTVYVQLSSETSRGKWLSKQYTYTAYGQTPPTPVPAVITAPTPGSSLNGTSVNFSWNNGTGVSQYSLSVGSSAGATDIYSANQGSNTTATVGNIPQDGRILYVTLGSLIGAAWTNQAYTYSAPNATASDPCSGISLGQGASLNGFVPFPTSNGWNQDISAAPVDSNSAAVISAIGATAGLHADFGSGTWNGAPIGIPYIVVDSTQPKSLVIINTYPGESDLPPMPIPANAPIEGYPNPGDQHVIVLDKSSCWEYDLGGASVSNGVWSADVSAVWDLQNGENRPYTWTSADAAGLPIFPGLVRYDEVTAGAIKHALRVTVPSTKPAFVLPATHWASTNASSPIPMGTRLRLKSSYDISSFSAPNQVILNAMKKYGLLVADNGSAMFFSGVPDSRWDDSDLHNLGIIPASAFEVVQMGTQYSASNIPSGAAPVIGSLTASAMTVPAGTPVTLYWAVTGASYSYISPQLGTARGSSAVVAPTATTTYTLTATNAFGRTTASITITVQ